jgi:hypothetical protein
MTTYDLLVTENLEFDEWQNYIGWFLQRSKFEKGVILHFSTKRDAKEALKKHLYKVEPAYSVEVIQRFNYKLYTYSIGKIVYFLTELSATQFCTEHGDKVRRIR